MSIVLFTAPCDCRLVQWSAETRMQFCPLHKAAPALLEALRALVEHSQYVRDHILEDYDSPGFLAKIAAGEAAIAAATEQKP